MEQNSPPAIRDEEVRDLLYLLDAHKSVGPDGIHHRMLREVVEELAKPFSIIYHQSWLTAEVPDDWRLPSVIPNHKKGWKEDLGKYTPVSLASVPMKVMEQIILSVIIWHIQDNQGSGSASTDLGKASCLTSLTSRCRETLTQTLTCWFNKEFIAHIRGVHVDKKIVRTEIGVLLRLSHPNIIKLKEIFETPTEISLVLELVTGGELFDRIVEKGYYSERDAADAVKQILEAVAVSIVIVYSAPDHSPLVAQ
ncbi:hypothetical protein WISP_63294 [Willisornis vidua]|uniref:Protein kinase domain-containing protein n=1 Tax=Willisornis vidua TaxID=1566151 RepID=A0ABQ9D9V7_9PASS|nr:hypothetical protein WISP_63294 [Willisornis vidua]